MKVATPPSYNAGERSGRGGGADGKSGNTQTRGKPHERDPFPSIFPLDFRNGSRKREQGKGLAQAEGTIYVMAIREANRTHAESALIRTPQALRK